MTTPVFQAEAPVSFTKVSMPWGWLGNMSRYPVVYEGMTYRTAEALFQALRFARNHPIREEIRAAKSPFQAKLLARAHQQQMIVAPRSSRDLDQMRLVLRLKVEQNRATLRDELTVLMGTGQAEIIEDCTRRPHGSGLFWGAALIDPAAGVWQGENWLGRLWMEMRTEGILCSKGAGQTDQLVCYQGASWTPDIWASACSSFSQRDDR